MVPGKVFPYVFITVMCGAVSGFHALVASGTTPKMVSKESHCRSIGYGAMLIEGLVGVVALIAVSSLAPGDYFAINASADKLPGLQLLGYHIEELPVLEAEVQEKVVGRVGGAVSLALGMAKIFSAIPGLRGLMAYWYHFAIMFEALFILTTIDTGTRIARFVMQEFLGKLIPKFEKTDWMPGTIFTSAVTVVAWGSFIYTGSIQTIWPMFGIANQLLAVIALCVGTSIILNSGKVRYVWVTAVPMVFVLVTTTSAAYSLIVDQFLPLVGSDDPGKVFRGYMNVGLTLVMVACMSVVLVAAARRWVSPRRAVA